MINDLYPKFKTFDRTAGLNGDTKTEVYVKSETWEIVQEVLRTWADIELLIKEAEDLKVNYKAATDKNSENSIVADISALNSRINMKFAHCNSEIDKIRREVNDEMRGDPECLDPTLRCRNLTSKALQAKIYHLIKRSQRTQLEIKVSIQEKIARQLTNYDKTLSPDQVQTLIGQPEKVEEIVRERMYLGTNVKIQTAINAIKEKLADIDALERNVVFLFKMIEDLAMIIKAQTDTVNSIEANMRNVKDSIEKAIKDFEKTKENTMSAQQKFCGILVGCLIVMTILINYVMGQLGII